MTGRRNSPRLRETLCKRFRKLSSLQRTRLQSPPAHMPGPLAHAVQKTAGRTLAVGSPGEADTTCQNQRQGTMPCWPRARVLAHSKASVLEHEYSVCSAPALAQRCRARAARLRESKESQKSVAKESQTEKRESIERESHRARERSKTELRECERREGKSEDGEKSSEKRTLFISVCVCRFVRCTQRTGAQLHMLSAVCMFAVQTQYYVHSTLHRERASSNSILS